MDLALPSLEELELLTALRHHLCLADSHIPEGAGVKYVCAMTKTILATKAMSASSTVISGQRLMWLKIPV